MIRRILYAVILAALLLAPVETMQIGTLHPVQAVLVSRQNGRIVIETDTQDRGSGDTVQAALQNLADTAAGEVYLDTAQYLLLTENALDAAEELRKVLRRGAELCMVSEPVDLTKTAEFLQTHGKLPQLRNWKKGDALPVLGSFEGRQIFLNM